MWFHFYAWMIHRSVLRGSINKQTNTFFIYLFHLFTVYMSDGSNIVMWDNAEMVWLWCAVKYKHMDKCKDMNILLNFCFRRNKNVIFTFKKVKITNYTTWDNCGDKKKPLVMLTHYYTSVNDDMKRCYKRTKKTPLLYCNNNTLRSKYILMRTRQQIVTMLTAGCSVIKTCNVVCCPQ